MKNTFDCLVIFFGVFYRVFMFFLVSNGVGASMGSRLHVHLLSLFFLVFMRMRGVGRSRDGTIGCRSHANLREFWLSFRKFGRYALDVQVHFYVLASFGLFIM